MSMHSPLLAVVTFTFMDVSENVHDMKSFRECSRHEKYNEYLRQRESTKAVVTAEPSRTVLPSFIINGMETSTFNPNVYFFCLEGESFRHEFPEVFVSLYRLLTGRWFCFYCKFISEPFNLCIAS